MCVEESLSPFQRAKSSTISEGRKLKLRRGAFPGHLFASLPETCAHQQELYYLRTSQLLFPFLERLSPFLGLKREVRKQL